MSECDTADLNSAVDRFDRESLWALLYAAGSAPELRERWFTLSFLIHAAATNSPSSASRIAIASDLPELLEAVTSWDPSIPMREDYVPKDPRDDVRVRLGEELVRLFPGSIERPVADVDRAKMLARVVDGALRAKVGFGIQDLASLVLRHVDRDIQLLEPVWPISINDNPTEVVTPDEVHQATQAIKNHSTFEPLSDAERKALDWITVQPGDLKFDPDDTQSPFGRAMRVYDVGGKEPRWLPLSILPDAFGYTIAQLAELVSNEEGIAGRFAREVASVVRHNLWKFGNLVIGSDETAEGPSVVVNGNVVQWISAPSQQRALLVQVVASITPSLPDFGDAGPAALQSKALSEVDTGQVPVRLPMSVLTLPPKTEVVPLLVVATAHHIMTPATAGMLAMSLDDLTWISANAQDQLDLYNFCRDMNRPDLPHYFGFETINAWEMWLANGKSLFSGGRAPDMMMLDPHSGDAEWDRTRHLRDLEIALATLAMPPVSELAAVEHDAPAPAHIMGWERIDGDAAKAGSPRARRKGFFTRGDPIGWDIHVGDFPVAIPTIIPSWPDGNEGMLLSELAGAIASGIGQIEDEWNAALSTTGTSGYIIRTSAALGTPTDAYFAIISPPLTTIGPSGPVYEFEIGVFCEALFEAGDGNPEALKTQMGRLVEQILLASSVPATQAAYIRSAWDAAPPTLTLGLLKTPTARENLSPPVTHDQAFAAIAKRLVAEGVRGAGVGVGIYRGQDAKDLDSKILAPLTLETLERRLANFSEVDIVRWGMTQLERVAERREKALGNISQSARYLQVRWDPAQKYTSTKAEYLALRRGNEILVEQALRLTPKGERTIDNISWAELLAFADVYLDATSRSEGIHHQVNPLALEVSHSFEIKEVQDDEDDELAGRLRYDLDINAFNEASAAEELDFAAPALGVVPQERKDALDAAMLMGFGATPLDIYTVLFALAQWPLTEDDNDAVEVTYSQALSHLDRIALLAKEPGGPARLRAAFGMMISTSKDLQDDDWKPWHSRTRKRRLLAQPLPMLSTGTFVIAPHYLKGVISVYTGYLEQGLLPWSQPQPPAVVNDALRLFRHSKNKVFEEDVAAEMRRHGWTVITNVKETKPGRLGLTSLQTEIDVVAGKAGETVIWLLEAKDPATVHALPEVRRALDSFFLDGSKPSYETQLGRKYDDLSPHAGAIAHALKLPLRPADDPYVVQARFVTRHPVPAGFVPSRFQFGTLSALIADISGAANEV